MTYSGSQHASSEPDCIALHVVGDHSHIDGLGLKRGDREEKAVWFS